VQYVSKACQLTQEKYIKAQQQRVQAQPNNEVLLKAALISCEDLLNIREEAQKYHVSVLPKKTH
jgi:hypothetical protein